ncbi:hypothetical protein M8542_00515 [Amycolatopsis sp. OK19-0408]|uniref:Uncharacterized protein n=1 Tax=Amycolatopsis iheyensis TaxID=2945988 RepID=A0A9X2N2Z9_9PSEU|nr:hypothetical protein [Amycolatopsis iheyensis]MCR6481291.1 hypothetical protein [Amycolatopsis iheyensis]
MTEIPIVSAVLTVAETFADFRIRAVTADADTCSITVPLIGALRTIVRDRRSTVHGELGAARRCGNGKAVSLVQLHERPFGVLGDLDRAADRNGGELIFEGLDIAGRPDGGSLVRLH